MSHILQCTSSTAAKQTTRFKYTAPLDPAWRQRVQKSYKLFVDTISTFSECLKVTRGPATIAPIDLVTMALPMFDFHVKLSPTSLADALRGLRTASSGKARD